MLQFVIRRVLVAIPVLFGVTLLAFSIIHLIPGDPAQIMLFGSNPTPQQIQNLRVELGLTQPYPIQYLDYLGRLIHGDLGQSFISSEPITHEIATQFPDTLALTIAAMVVAVLIGAPLGILAGARPHTWLDHLATGVAVLGVAIPYFWLALVLILLLAVRLHVLPSLGEGSPQAIILPALSLGWGFAAVIARLLRNNLIEIYHRPFMQVARAKGLSGWRVLTKHAVKNALLPVVTILGLQFGNLLSGAVAIEVIFGRRGIGSYLVSAIQAKDIPAVQGIMLFIAVIYIVINLVVDVTYGLLDPRIRLS
jgi:ABC-type dipeptide/oligopeptide/nickel transport system permease component